MDLYNGFSFSDCFADNNIREPNNLTTIEMTEEQLMEYFKKCNKNAQRNREKGDEPERV